ncbi:MAG: hypothetical protein QOD24_3705, partial [Solirubrobacteraceae bacterium]|nr:hypothetical protein [Solirubrobacteraceae bacterium]
RVVAEPLGQAAIPSNIEEAQRVLVSTFDTIDLDGDEEIDIRGWIRTFADSGRPIYVGIYTSPGALLLADRLRRRLDGVLEAIAGAVEQPVPRPV